MLEQINGRKLQNRNPTIAILDEGLTIPVEALMTVAGGQLLCLASLMERLVLTPCLAISEMALCTAKERVKRSMA